MRRSPFAALALALLAASCSDDAEADPVAVDATIEQHPVSAISAVLHVSTSREAEVTVEVRGEEGSFEIPAGDGEEPVPVVGMRPESAYEVVVRAVDDDGGTAEEVLTWTTASLPEALPDIRLDGRDGDRSHPGVTVMNALPFNPAPEGETPDAGFVVAVDAEGFVVWYHQMPLQILDVDTTSRGTFLVTGGDTTIHEIDLLGRTVKEWAGRIATDGRGTDLNGRALVGDDAVPVELDSAHHEVTELPNGNVLTLSTGLLELDEAEGARLCPDDPARWIVEDVVVELAPDGDVVGEWRLSDVLDPVERPGSELCLPQNPVAPPMWFYPEAEDVRDWTHANAIALDADANALHVSLRHLDSIVALRYQDDDEGPAGELLWELGPDGTLELAPGGEHLSHQHANEIVGPNELLIYDNGNRKDPEQSRAVVFRVDPEAGTAEQVWEHRDTTHEGELMYTPFLGDVDRLPNGNVLITHGGASTSAGVLYGRIVEVEPETHDIVWDLTLGDQDTGAWTIYRAERHPSLYDLAG